VAACRVDRALDRRTRALRPVRVERAQCPRPPAARGQCAAAAAAAMTKRAAGLAAGSLRQASPQQRGHCLGSADTQRAPPPQHRWPAAKNARGVGPFVCEHIRCAQTLAGGEGVAGDALAHDADEVGRQRGCQNGQRVASAQRVVFAWRSCWHWDLHWEGASVRHSARYSLVRAAVFTSPCPVNTDSNGDIGLRVSGDNDAGTIFVHS